ncbi:MAG: LysR family transcriptional regulator [Planctomycetes bacterium]|nr:LysR family transcriptional regulator [Planctomycetota bacterium]
MPPAYKDLSLAQLRAFCQTVRLGSLAAAAEHLGLAQPTVWKLVHAFEKRIGQTLFITNRRGTIPNEAGRALYPIASAGLTNVESLPSRLAEMLEAAEVRITIAASPRMLAEEIVPAVAEFVKQQPNTRFTLLEMETNEVAPAVDAGQAELGFTPAASNPAVFPRLTCTRWYDLDVLLVMRPDHPLATRRIVRVKDLSKYPLLFPRANLNDFPNPAALAAERLDEHQTQWVSARQASVLRRCVTMGFGAALLLGRAGQANNPELVERVMSNELGRAPIYLVRRVGVIHHPAIDEFATALRATLASTGGD